MNNKNLVYKNAKFDTFVFYGGTIGRTLTPDKIITLDNLNGTMRVNICKKHVKQYGLYNEIGLTEEQTKKFRRFIIDGSICCIEGCNCDRVWDIDINTKECELVD